MVHMITQASSFVQCRERTRRSERQHGTGWRWRSVNFPYDRFGL